MVLSTRRQLFGHSDWLGQLWRSSVWASCQKDSVQSPPFIVASQDAENALIDAICCCEPPNSRCMYASQSVQIGIQMPAQSPVHETGKFPLLPPSGQAFFSAQQISLTLGTTWATCAAQLDLAPPPFPFGHLVRTRDSRFTTRKRLEMDSAARQQLNKKIKIYT